MVIPLCLGFSEGCQRQKIANAGKHFTKYYIIRVQEKELEDIKTTHTGKTFCVYTLTYNSVFLFFFYSKFLSCCLA